MMKDQRQQTVSQYYRNKKEGNKLRVKVVHLKDKRNDYLKINVFSYWNNNSTYYTILLIIKNVDERKVYRET